jgi:hypothetical protein
LEILNLKGCKFKADLRTSPIISLCGMAHRRHWQESVNWRNLGI